MSSKEGFQWTAATGLKSGLPCEGVKLPSKKLPASGRYDVIVIGAGFAGIIASRDLALRGHKVLLLEARDRIGGRAWTSTIDGFPYEIGAAWFHWNQPHMLSQVSRYGLQGELNFSFDLSGGVDKSNLHIEDMPQGEVDTEVSVDEQDSMYEKLGALYFNVDGEMGRKVMPYPALPFHNPEVLEYDNLTAFDRVEQIREDLTDLEANALKSYLLLLSGGTAENTGFLDLLHWWMLCNNQSGTFGSQADAYKLKHGTTTLVRRFLDDGLRSGNLEVLLSHPISSITDEKGQVSVSSNGDTYSAARVISTIPLNVLSTVDFSPPLSPAKKEALAHGHVGLHTKVHFDAMGTDLRTWSGYSYPGHGLLYAYGDETTSRGSTHVVAFGASTNVLEGENNVEKIQKALHHLRPDVNIERILFHDWVKDPYSRGSWCMFSKGFASQYLSTLQEPHGNVWFASADWADGWRGFIDGAIEQGAHVAQEVADSFSQT
ncbi:hypothetical protein H2204_005637 [Knufia peltigerae]|uniref:Amine oxidase n=1 Tax=Knufia peltigerae TaxID=1002370 RepID=A0AA38Y531_9EURO|nr:hypothetical protein H2204_005637 [Knufia peltigerae]